jgi:hypothetical protein
MALAAKRLWQDGVFPACHDGYHQPLVAMIFLIISSFFFSTISILCA